MYSSYMYSRSGSKRLQYICSVLRQCNGGGGGGGGGTHRRWYKSEFRAQPSPPLTTHRRQLTNQIEGGRGVSSSLNSHFISNDFVASMVLKMKGDGDGYVTILENQSIAQVAEVLLGEYVGAAIVMDKSGEHVAGIVTERDMLKVLMNENDVDSSSNVSTVMTPSRRLVTVHPSDSARDCMDLIMHLGIRFLPVVDDKELHGVITIRDIIDAQTRLQSGRQYNQLATQMSSKGAFMLSVLPRKGIKDSVSVSGSKKSVTGTNLCLDSAVSSVPHPMKKKQQSEDAYFIVNSVDVARSMNRSLSDECMLSVIGVADGVGSYSFESDVDPAEFSSFLMNSCEKAVVDYIEKVLHDTQPTNDRASRERHPRRVNFGDRMDRPDQLVFKAWSQLQEKSIVGGSTYSVLSFDGKSSQLRCANLGDSGFIVLREVEDRSRIGTLDSRSAMFTRTVVYDWDIVFRSPQQVHYFNCPFQLGISEQRKSDEFDSPTDGEHFSIILQEGDIVILATDGLFDNMFDEDILGIVADGTSSPSVLARRLAQRARYFSTKQDRDGPFALLGKDNGVLWSGGHPDDITIIVSRVVRTPFATENSLGTKPESVSANDTQI